MSAHTLWNDLVAAQRMAQVARETMRNTQVDQLMRDDATKVLVIQTDRILDTLQRMSDLHLLAQIGTVLNARGR